MIRNKNLKIALGGAWLALSFSSGARPVTAAIDFDFIYSGSVGSGVGFEDPVLGQARRNALEEAAGVFGSWFDHTASITMNVTSIDDSSSSTLASAGTVVVGGGLRGFGNMEVIRTKIFTDFDRNFGSPDGSLNVNWAKNWEISSDPSDVVNVVGNRELDFFSVVFHELSHALGFFSVIQEDGADRFGTTPPGRGRWSQYDQFISDKDGNTIIDTNSLVLNQALWDEEREGGASPNGGLFFKGPKAVAANGGQLVGLYSPEEFSKGSSVSHLDEQNPTLRNSLMSAIAAFGPGPREFNDLEKAIFEDLGYSFVELDLIDGDTNGDGKVDAGDLNVLAINWQKFVTGGVSDADFNDSGFVDAGDLNTLALNWQNGVITADANASLLPFHAAWTQALANVVVPEPSVAFVMASLGWVLGLGLPRRYRNNRL